MVVFYSEHFSQNVDRFTDILRFRTDQLLTVRFVEPRDAQVLQNYFRSLSKTSRYRRLMGAASELSPLELDRTLRVGDGNRFAVVVEMKIEGVHTIIAEARYAFDPRSRAAEFSISVHDKWQGQGIGTALLGDIECRVATLGALTLFGDTVRDNESMFGLLRKQGFRIIPSSFDWRQIRVEKSIVNGAALNSRCEKMREKMRAA
jgi:GNAT superfamily N-acetyltransferase